MNKDVEGSWRYGKLQLQRTSDRGRHGNGRGLGRLANPVDSYNGEVVGDTSVNLKGETPSEDRFALHFYAAHLEMRAPCADVTTCRT